MMPESSASLEVALEFWSAFDVEKKRSDIDEKALRMAELDQKSVKARSLLSASVKEARANKDAGQLRTCVKHFQKEVDSLTERAKYAEQCFMALYKQLYQAPDPVPGIRTAIELDKSGGEAKSTREMLSVYEKEFKGLKNQEVTIRRLEEANSLLKEEIVKAHESGMSDARSAWDAQKEEIVSIYKERENELVNQVSIYKREADEIRQAHARAQSQLCRAHDAEEAEELVRDGETLLLAEEVERLRLESERARHDRDEARGIIETLRGREVEEVGRACDWEGRVKRLGDQLDSCKFELSQSKVLLDKQKETIHNESLAKTRLESRITELQGVIDALPTSEEMVLLKRQVYVLQAVGFNALEDDMASTEMEKVLLSKNRRLEGDLARAHVEHSECKDRVEVLELDLAECESSLVEHTRTVRDLEKQLEYTYSMSTLTDHNDSEEQSRLDIVAGQRDRYRLRHQQLEEEQSILLSKLDSMKQEAGKLRTDNLKLYERLRFAQTSKGSGGDIETGDHMEKRYSAMYEDSHNLFNAFNKTQKQARYRSLTATDKITFQTAHICLGSKVLRKVLFFYAISLHVLVFITLWTHVMSPHC